MLVTETVPKYKQRVIRPAHSGSKVSKEVNVGIVRGFSILCGIRVNHQPPCIAATAVSKIGQHASGPQRNARPANHPVAFEPIEGAVQLSKPRDALKITWLSSDAWRVVMDVQIEP